MVPYSVPLTPGPPNCCVPIVPMVLVAPVLKRLKPNCCSFGSVNFGKFDFQQNLAFVQRRHLQRTYDLGANRPSPSC